MRYSQTRSNTQRDLMNPDEVLRLENRKCLALFKGHKPALLYKMTPEELPDEEFPEEPEVLAAAPMVTRSERI